MNTNTTRRPCCVVDCPGQGREEVVTGPFRLTLCEACAARYQRGGVRLRPAAHGKGFSRFTFVEE